jgi:DNA-binding SARP family transcriptional activator
MQATDAGVELPRWERIANSEIGLALMRGFSLVHRREPVSLPLAAQRVVAFVALRDRPTLRLHVASSLWIDLPEKRALANLRSALWRLRQPGIDVVIASGAYLSLRGNVTVDVRELTTRSKAMLAAGAGRPGANYDEVLSAGDLLPDWYDDWVLIERERLRQLRLHALEQASADLAAEHRYGEAIQAALAVIADEPLRETAHRQLIEVYLAEGNRVEAVRQYDAYARIIREELGLQPAREIRDLLGPTLPRIRRHCRDIGRIGLGDAGRGIASPTSTLTRV